MIRITKAEYEELKDYLMKKGFSEDNAADYLVYLYPELREEVPA